MPGAGTWNRHVIESQLPPPKLNESQHVKCLEFAAKSYHMGGGSGGEMTWSVKYLSLKQEELSLNPSTPFKNLNMVADICNPGTRREDRRAEGEKEITAAFACWSS